MQLHNIRCTLYPDLAPAGETDGRWRCRLLGDVASIADLRHKETGSAYVFCSSYDVLSSTLVGELELYDIFPRL